MIDLYGLTLDPLEKELLQHPQVGGILLFTRNYESKDQLKSLITSIRKINPNCLIAVDQEGGRVQRFRHDFTPMPAFRTYGELYEANPQDAILQAEKMAYLMARELKEMGIDLSFSPVLDIDIGVSSVIGDRSFHHEGIVVTELGRAFIRGMHKAKMPATGKHFPGHGTVAADSHTALPIDTRDFQAIYENDLQPFMKLQTDLDAIMPAHILFDKIDDKPVCFSQYWLQKVLRCDLNFTGVIFSDDLSMAGAQIIGDYITRANTALMAGCDMILICNQREHAIAVLDNLLHYHNAHSRLRIEHLRRNIFD